LTLSKNAPVDAREMARQLGRRGGRARAKRLSPERRRQIASLGGQARRRSLLAARRIADNLRYAAAVWELRGEPPKLVRMKTFTGRLPGLYPEAS
jgi:general stress protein YciG